MKNQFFKECSCGNFFEFIPDVAIETKDAFWWNCEKCGHTVYVPSSEAQESSIEKSLIQKLIEQLRSFPSIQSVEVVTADDVNRMAKMAGE